MLRFGALLFLTITSLHSYSFAKDISLSRKLEILVSTYPDVLTFTSGGELYFKGDVAPLVVDDGHTKTHQETLKSADIEDMLRQIYPTGPCETKPVTNFDPGRIRVDKFFKRLYGASREQVKKRLVTVKWLDRSVNFHPFHGAATALKHVRAEIAKLPRDIRRPAMKTAGTFNWRKIAKTQRLSVHSFGAAIDLDVKYSNYWQWSGGKPGNVPVYENRIPMQIVDIFEHHGFIWGGRWYHYDTMHFEYRPELIAISKESHTDTCTNQ